MMIFRRLLLLMVMVVVVVVVAVEAETVAPSEEDQPTLGPWAGFEPVRLETPRTPKHAWFHCTTGPPLVRFGRDAGRTQAEPVSSWQCGFSAVRRCDVEGLGWGSVRVLLRGAGQIHIQATLTLHNGEVPSLSTLGVKWRRDAPLIHDQGMPARP
ncbi:hypothetical protein E2C01_014165 [Portunus trituberculatus]|uniref:Uncharacterized protein n=1 Tax=Portunus trituberculatus TaxID=210409 RepID=A0A5B7DIF9_PORTR|nr:hypothetical protein [Portunus trituberculatus]